MNQVSVDAIQEFRDIEVTRVYEENRNSWAQTVVNVGGARSSKTHSIIQLFIEKFRSERNKVFLTTRKTMPSLRMTTYKDTIGLLKEYGFYNPKFHNKTNRTYECPFTGNLWYFVSVDDAEKMRSAEFNYVHMEEANEFTYDDYMTLILRLSGHVEIGEMNQLFMSLNPTEEDGWINEKLPNRKNAQWIRSTYKDAIKFLPPDYVKSLESLEIEDPVYWKIYGLGEYAQIAGIIYGAIPLCDPRTNPWPLSFDEIIYGLDFGYNNPCALMELGIRDIKNLYFTELLYQTHLTNADLIDLMKELIPDKKRIIYADPSEPERIEEIWRAGFNIQAADNKVRPGIDLLQRCHKYTKEENVNFNKEMRRYKFKEDRAGRILDEPVKYEDHTPDASRYAAFTHLKDLLILPHRKSKAYNVSGSKKKEKDAGDNGDGESRGKAAPIEDPPKDPLPRRKSRVWS